MKYLSVTSMTFKAPSLLFWLLFISSSLKAEYKAINGVLDLSTFNFNTSTAKVSGQWEFYSGLHTPQDLNSPDVIHTYKVVPGSWADADGNFLHGFGTYRLRILLPEGSDNLVLLFPVINTAAKIFVNGKLQEELGLVSADPKIHRGKLGSIIVAVPPGSQLEVVIQVSNYSYFSSGIVRTPQLGKSSILLKAFSIQHSIENVFIGSLVAIFIYHVFLFLLYRKGESNLYLGLICLLVALRAATMNGSSSLLPDLFAFVDFEYWKKIEFGAVYAIVALFPMYIASLFPQKRFIKITYWFMVVAGVLCVAVLVTDQPVYGKLLNIAHLGLLAGFVFAGYVIFTALKNNIQDAKTILWGIAASFPFVFLEILHNSGLLNVNFNYMVELGVLIFLLFQSYMLANRNAQAYASLQFLNLRLEENVKTRTAELVKANRIKDKLLSVVSHDIKGPLNSLGAILNLFNQHALNPQELREYISKIETELQRNQILFENILMWTSSQMKGLKIKKEDLSAFDLGEEHVNLFKQIAGVKRVQLMNSIDQQLIVYADKNIISLVLRNLISNAIKFTEAGGTVTLTSHNLLHENVIYVQDSGTGMREETIDKIFSTQTNESTSGTNNEKGTGLGLILCKEYMEQMGGQITVESKLGEGSNFIIHLPFKE